MKSRMSGMTLMGLAVGVAAGAAAALLAAPMRGADMRATLRQRASDGGVRMQSLAASGRSWAQTARDRAMQLVDEGRRAFQARRGEMSDPAPLSATLGEIAQTHSSDIPRVGVVS